MSVEAARYTLFKERLLALYPETDEETLHDTLEGITDLHEMIAAVIRSALVDEALQAGLRTRIEEMRQRLTRLAERGFKKRQMALEAMNEAGLKKLEQPDFTASARLGAPPLVVTSEHSVPVGIGYHSLSDWTDKHLPLISGAAIKFLAPALEMQLRFSR